MRLGSQDRFQIHATLRTLYPYIKGKGALGIRLRFDLLKQLLYLPASNAHWERVSRPSLASQPKRLMANVNLL